MKVKVMFGDKIFNIPVIALGAINGILCGTVSEIVLRSLFLLERYFQSREPLPQGISISLMPYPFNWYALPLLFFVLGTIAVFIAHCCLARRIKSSVWYWQTVSVVSILLGVAYTTIGTFYYWFNSSRYPAGLEFVVNSIKFDLLLFLSIYLIIAAFNLLFALFLKKVNWDFS